MAARRSTSPTTSQPITPVTTQTKTPLHAASRALTRRTVRPRGCSTTWVKIPVSPTDADSGSPLATWLTRFAYLTTWKRTLVDVARSDADLSCRRSDGKPDVIHRMSQVVLFARYLDIALRLNLDYETMFANMIGICVRDLLYIRP